MMTIPYHSVATLFNAPSLFLFVLYHLLVYIYLVCVYLYLSLPFLSLSLVSLSVCPLLNPSGSLFLSVYG